jgi:hypothetical protein
MIDIWIDANCRFITAKVVLIFFKTQTSSCHEFLSTIDLTAKWRKKLFLHTPLLRNEVFCSKKFLAAAHETNYLEILLIVVLCSYTVKSLRRVTVLYVLYVCT